MVAADNHPCISSWDFGKAKAKAYQANEQNQGCEVEDLRYKQKNEHLGISIYDTLKENGLIDVINKPKIFKKSI